MVSLVHTIHPRHWYATISHLTLRAPRNIFIAEQISKMLSITLLVAVKKRESTVQRRTDAKTTERAAASAVRTQIQPEVPPPAALTSMM